MNRLKKYYYPDQQLDLLAKVRISIFDDESFELTRQTINTIDSLLNLIH